MSGYAHLKFTAHAEGTGVYTTGGFNNVAVIAKAMCEDGVVRTIRLNSTGPDTFFSHPGRTSIKRKSVRGYVTMGEVAASKNYKPTITSIVKFTAYKEQG